MHKNLSKINTNLMKLEQNLDANIEKIKNALNSEDVTFLDLQLANRKGVLIFINDIVDKNAVGELILRPISNIKNDLTEQELFDLFLSPEKSQINSIKEILNDVLLGNTVLIIENSNTALSFALKFFEKRAITEPPTSTVIKGPREGFVESLPVNISLMRRRLKTPDLRIENTTVGKYSRTPIALCYIKGIVDEKLVKTLKNKLSQIDIDAILDSSYLSKCLGERTVSLFKQIGNTEKPDILAGKILEGRVAIFVDGSPIALTVPYLLIEDFQSASDYYNSAYSATFARQIRLLSVFIALFLPTLFVSAELFHLQLIPLSFLLTIVNSIKGIPLSPSYEMFFTLMIFEILNEASVRMPKYVGMVVSIVGGLVLGETAVTAGIISAPTLMIIALSGICLYTVPELEQTFSILRMIFLVVAGTCGIYGLIISVSFIFIYLISFESYGSPIFAPFSPLVKEDLKDTFYKGFLHEHQFRPNSIKNKNKRRLKISKIKK
ncbi:MAG: spore germination protein [Clostridia bacterium]|nr:spore germination protein [Clostridia bacterium]